LDVLIKKHTHIHTHTVHVFNPWSHVQCYTGLLHAEEIPKGF
jgi:hypothetical protein